MSDQLTAVATNPEILQERAINQKVVEAYLAIKGPSVEERMAMMHDEIMYEIAFTMDCVPQRTCSAEKLRRRFMDNAKCWGEFSYSNITIIPTDRPDTFMVDCDADGTMVSPMYTAPRPYHNYYNIIFVIRDGKVWQLRQFTNPMKLIHDFWRDMPDTCK